MTRSCISVGGVAIGLLMAFVPFAATAAKAPRAVAAQSLYDCKNRIGDAQQLACYIKAAGELEAAEDSGQVVITDGRIAQETRKANFGLAAPDLRLPKEAHKPDKPVGSMTFEIERIGHTGAGGTIFHTTSGATWIETENRELPGDPVKGSKLVVNRGSFGSYFCFPEKMFAVQCKRLP